jgi:hypothetical protein
VAASAFAAAAGTSASDASRIPGVKGSSGSYGQTSLKRSPSNKSPSLPDAAVPSGTGAAVGRAAAPPGRDLTLSLVWFVAVNIIIMANLYL